MEDNLGKLQAFITGEKFASVPDAEQNQSVLQHKIIESYAPVLEQRIAAF